MKIHPLLKLEIASKTHVFSLRGTLTYHQAHTGVGGTQQKVDEPTNRVVALQKTEGGDSCNNSRNGSKLEGFGGPNRVVALDSGLRKLLQQEVVALDQRLKSLQLAWFTIEGYGGSDRKVVAFDSGLRWLLKQDLVALNKRVEEATTLT